MKKLNFRADMEAIKIKSNENLKTEKYNITI